ncbi:hypothetical protein DSECCO2_646740 [anaerobic digester metagenome]
MTGVAVNERVAPSQSGFEPDVRLMETSGVTEALTVIVMPVLVAIVGFAQGEFEVITQVTD